MKSSKKLKKKKPSPDPKCNDALEINAENKNACMAWWEAYLIRGYTTYTQIHKWVLDRSPIDDIAKLECVQSSNEREGQLAALISMADMKVEAVIVTACPGSFDKWAGGAGLLLKHNEEPDLYVEPMYLDDTARESTMVFYFYQDRLNTLLHLLETHLFSKIPSPLLAISPVVRQLHSEELDSNEFDSWHPFAKGEFNEVDYSQELAAKFKKKGPALFLWPQQAIIDWHLASLWPQWERKNLYWKERCVEIGQLVSTEIAVRTLQRYAKDLHLEHRSGRQA